jgi:pimeloyl-ACP methyl ester carboxylesterase
MPLLRWIAVLVLLAACSAPRPDLARLYASQANPRQPPVVLIHGILGSRLEDPARGAEAWPGSAWRLLFHDYRDLALAIDAGTLSPLADDLRVTGITDRAAGRDFYGEIMRVLSEAGGYRRGHPGDPVAPGEKKFYVFAYDWRQDNVATARALDAFIEQIRRDHADPQMKVDVIAHSMGGLAARYYIRYGTQDVLDDNEFPVNGHGAQRIRRAILLGTPNLGSVTAIQTMLEGVRTVFGGVPPEVVATFPSVYQLLPHPLNDWLIKSDGEALDRDIFDVEIWRRFQFSVFSPQVRRRISAAYEEDADARVRLELLERYFHRQLERGRRFVWSLTVPVSEPSVRYIVFGGVCNLTPARILVEEVDGESVIRLWPGEIAEPVPGVDYDILMLEPGDGVVTKASLLARDTLDPTVRRHRYSFFPMRYSFFLCEAHNRLTGNINFQDNLLHALLSVDDELL